MHIPLTGRSQTVGVLSLGSFRENVFAPADLPFLTQIARQVAIAIENALAFGEVSDQKDKLAREKLYLDLTGLGCYHKKDVPAWYDKLSESDRWDAQARFWEAVAGRCA